MTHALRAALALMPLALGCGSPDIPEPVGPEQPDPSTSGWSALAWPNAPGRFEDVYFVDEDHGWLVAPGTGPGSVYRTTDGGAGWERRFLEDGIVPWAVGFATPDVGWLANQSFVLSDLPPLYETLDGGETWRPVSDRINGPVAKGMSGIFVLDRDNVFAVGRYTGPAYFMRSNDGGATWTSSDLAPLANGLTDVHFLDASTGVAVGGVGEGMSAFQAVVLRTEDGGASWRQVYRGQTQGRHAWRISFPTPSVGYVSTDGWGLNRGGAVLKTEDGGHTWRELAVGPTRAEHYNRLWGIGFLSPDTGWVSADAEIYRTNDGGRSWSEASFGQNVSRFRFLPSGRGYAGGPLVYRFNP